MIDSGQSQGPKRWIRPLPEQVVNKIAAGEVVERPSAVVKELVENAIDAQAGRIEISVDKSGTRCITVVDNGCGIPADQIEVAFSRHATSKIVHFDDLNSLYSYGFRGEALPSIASVSRMRMVSRVADESSGTEIIIEGGVLQSCRPIPSAPGTLVEVENLFFNTPARRKFLKSEATEARHISRIATALALSRPEIGFSYTLNGRQVFSALVPTDLTPRVASVLGQDRRFIRVTGETDLVAVQGCIGPPDMGQHNRYGQFVFVNGRYVQSPTLSHAFQAGYGELLPKGVFPVGAVLLTVSPGDVDVNVHPGKTEVRLSREREIHDTVYRLIRESLRQDGVIPALPEAKKPDTTGEGLADRHRAGGEAPSAPERTIIPGVYGSPAHDAEALSELYGSASAGGPSEVLREDGIRVDTRTGEILEDDNLKTTAAEQASVRQDELTGPSQGFHLIGRFADLYLLLQAGDDLYIVDQHTAHERVLYEETLRKIEAQSVHGQNLLFPVQVELTPEQLAVFEELGPLLKDSGFVVSPFGGRMVNIESVPSVLTGKSPERVFRSIVDDVASLRKAGCDLIKAMAQSIACRSAVMAGDKLSDEEARQLLTELLRCQDKYSCPHGRPTFIRISKTDLDKQFGRA